MAELLSIQMQRSDPAFPWGFSVRSNEVDQVTSGTLAALHLASGDKILEINKVKTRQMSQNEIEAFINGSCKTLDLLIIKANSADNHETDKLNDLQNGVTAKFKDRGGSQDSWDSGRSTLTRQYKSKTNQEHLDPAGSKDNSGQTQSLDFPIQRQESRYDRWIQNQEKNSRNHLMDQPEEINNKSNPHSKRGYFYDRSQHQCDHDKELFIREEQPNDYRESRVSPVPDKVMISNTYSNNQRRDHIPRRINIGSNGMKNRNRLSLNIDDLRRQGFCANMETPYFLTKNSCDSTPDSWDNRANDDSMMKSAHLLNPRRSWHENILSERLTKNILSKSEFKKSITTVNESYSTYGSANALETHEELNITNETEEHTKIDGDREEVTKKTSENQEYILTNKDIVNGQPNEIKKTVNDCSIAESVIINGEKEFSNKTKNRSEEVQQSPSSNRFHEHTDFEATGLRKNVPQCNPTYSPATSPDKNRCCTNVLELANIDSTDESSIYFSPIKSNENGLADVNNHNRTLSNDSQIIQSDVWRRPLTGHVRTPSRYWKNLEDRQGDITFWEVSPERKSNKTRSLSNTSNHAGNNSDFSYGYSSLTSECPSLPTVNVEVFGNTTSTNNTTLKRPTEFLSENFKEFKGKVPRGKIKIPAVFSKYSGNNTEQSSSKQLPSNKESTPEVEEAIPCKTEVFNSKETKTDDIHIQNETDNKNSIPLIDQKDCDTSTKNCLNGKSSKIKKFIYDFETADKMSQEENKKYREFRTRSRERSNPPNSSNLKDMIQDCAFNFSASDAIDSYSNYNGKSNRKIPENGMLTQKASVSCPSLSDDQFYCIGQASSHTSDIEDDVFTNGDVIKSPNPTINFPDPPGKNSQDNKENKEEVKSRKNGEPDIHQKTRTIDVDNSATPQQDPFTFWMNNVKNQEKQKNFLNLLTPKPFSSHSESTLKARPQP